MKTIIAGSRHLTDMNLVLAAVKNCGWEITEVVSGCASGVDSLGITWASITGTPLKEFPADWDNLDAPGAIVKTATFGKKYNAKAGIDRNQRMANYSDALILIHNGSKGSADMLHRAKAKGLRIYEVKV